MTLCARIFSRNCVSSRLDKVSATGKQGSLDATDWNLRKEDSAQQGVSSLPLHAQIIACSLHSGGEGGSQKQIRESARHTFCFCVYVSSDGTSSIDGQAETKRKQRRLKQSASGRARAISKAGEDPTLALLSFLKRVSVSHGTEAKYKKRVEQFLSFAEEEKLALVADDKVDATVVQYLNLSYSQGRPVSTESWGDKNSLGRGEL